VNASIDESDLGQIRANQAVTFRVDAYPSETFHGTVSQVRLNPTTSNNVVTYAAIIDAPNTALKLKPGMTATVTIEVARRNGVLRVPSAALRFKPDAKLQASLGATAPAATKSPTVWVSDGGRITPATVKVGASDQTFTELVDPAIAEGTLVVTRVASATKTTTSASSSAASNPLMPTRPPGPPR